MGVSELSRLTLSLSVNLGLFVCSLMYFEFSAVECSEREE